MKEHNQIIPLQHTSEIPDRHDTGLELIYQTPDEILPIGTCSMRTDIPSTIPEFRAFQEHKVKYPPTVVTALKNITRDYHSAMGTLVGHNQEWDTDYQHLQTHQEPSAAYVSPFVQIDLAGIPYGMLDAAQSVDPHAVEHVLRQRIFEIESNLAMLNLLRELHSTPDSSSRFKQVLDESLDDIRIRHGKKIALVASTTDKYHSIRAAEFGVTDQSEVPDEVVRTLSGFDRLLSPSNFMRYIDSVGDHSDYLFYGRTSLDAEQLKRPSEEPDVPEILSNPRYRRALRRYGITLNIDNPSDSPNSNRVINDTKAYLPLMGMSFRVDHIDDLNSQAFADYIHSRGLSFDREMVLRAKPLAQHYGAIGHVRDIFQKERFRNAVARNIAKKGPYVIQPEIQPPVLINTSEDNLRYNFIDRVFIYSASERPEDMVLMGGFRGFVPESSTEAKNGRLHGNKDSIWAEIKPSEE